MDDDYPSMLPHPDPAQPLSPDDSPPRLPGPLLNPRRLRPAPGPPDPGSRPAALIAWVLGALLVLGVILTNQLEGTAATPVPVPDIKVLSPDPLDPVAMGAKMMVKIKGLGLPMQPSDRATMMGQIDSSVRTPADRFRAAVAAGEIEGDAAARERLDTLEALSDTFATDAPGLDADIALYRRILDGDAALTDDERDAFRARHGWVARLALSYGLPDSDPARAPLLAGGVRLFAGFAFATLVVLVALFGGVTAFVLALVRLSNRGFRRRFVRPAPGGSVFLESAAFFVGIFLLFKFVVSAIVAAASPPAPEWAVTFQLASQWALLALPFYPLLRGVRWGALKEGLGWHRGEGVWREIRAGIAGYFVGLPILGVAMVITLVIVFTRSMLAGDDDPPANPIAELLGEANTLQVVLLFCLATIWAPIVEEATFRGSFFRHLRSRLPAWGAAAISAVVFGLMHGYEIILLLPVMTLGFTFALMREWRGSLIAPMTAHALHNGTLLLIVIAILGPLMD